MPKCAACSTWSSRSAARNGATTIEVARTEEQRARIWKGRKAAFAAMGRVSPNYYVQDGVVPQDAAAGSARTASASSNAPSGLRIGNVFHAGDGNLHPLICYDEKVPGQAEQAEAVAAEILAYCVEAGGSLTGEHGVGADKSQYMPRMFSDDDLALMTRVRGGVRSARSLQSRQGLADAAALRRSAGAVPRASGRARTGSASASDVIDRARQSCTPGRMRLDTRAADPDRDGVDGVVPRLVVEPETARRGRGDAAVGRRHAAVGRDPRAAARSAAGAPRPAPIDVLLDMSALNRILAHQARRPDGDASRPGSASRP